MTSGAYNSGMLFTQAHRLVRAQVSTVLEKHQLSFIHWSILSIVLASDEGIRLTNVAAALGVKAPLITLESNRLITLGLINRVAHHSDGRAKLLVMTAKGKKLAVTISDELETLVGTLMQGLSKTEIQSFEKTLKTIIQNS